MYGVIGLCPDSLFNYITVYSCFPTKRDLVFLLISLKFEIPVVYNENMYFLVIYNDQLVFKIIYTMIMQMI